MARYARAYEGEKRTAKVTVQLTPSERATLEKGAERAGAPSLSQHARELCLRRSAAAQIVAGTRRDPMSLALMNELTAIGNNLNQLTKLSNTEKAAPQLHELRSTTDLLKAALAHVLAL
ncbi:MAG: plasmid mobilization protein [Beijerinckiaceae bacterium]